MLSWEELLEQYGAHHDWLRQIGPGFPKGSSAHVKEALGKGNQSTMSRRDHSDLLFIGKWRLSY